MLEYLRKQLAALAEQRAAAFAAVGTTIAAAQTENRAPTEAESTAFAEKRAALAALDESITTMSGQIAGLEEDEKRGQTAADILAAAGQTGQKRSGGAVVGAEPQTYARGNGNSYFLDLARAQVRQDATALARLQRHAAELDVELPARAQRREQLAREEVRSIEGLTGRDRESVFEKRVNPNRTDGQGGYFVPPLWLVDQYIDLPRFGRQAANLCNQMTLPAGTDSINIPKVNTGTATGVQTADAGAVTSQDMTDTFVNAPVRTIAGQQDVAMQLLDQSPAAFDQIVYQDLQADLNQKLDLQVLTGSGTNGQALGILNVIGLNAITYTDASPTLPEMYLPFAQAASQVFKNRKLPATAALMIPSLWYWATSQLDTTNRPLITPMAPAFNPAAMQNGLAEEGPLGMLSLGLPVFGDGNIPTNLGAGTNETRVIAARWNDLYLWEGEVRTRVLTEVLSGTLQIRFQVWQYFAFMPHRRPETISAISGTGLIPPAGF